jgi:hypothetical protein
MKKTYLLSVVVCLILVSCSGQKGNPTVFPSVIPEQSSTASLTPTKARPTLTAFPFYQDKQIIFDYYRIGDHSIYDIFFEPDFFRSYSRLVLYADGQLIIPGETYKQKILSPIESEQFLYKLEELGFYSLESNQKHDPTDKLYDYGNNYQVSYDGRLYCILVNTDKTKKLCAYEPDLQYLTPKMKNILQYLDEYEPVGMTPYFPDRILLWVQVGRDPYDENLPTTTTPWDESLPSLDTANQIMYVDGDAAKEIYLLFDNTNAGKVFTQNGREYTVYINVVLPHEKVTNAYQ